MTEMTTDNSRLPTPVLAWRILWTEEPDGLLSMGSYRVGCDWSDLACMHTSEKEMPTHASILAWRNPGTEELGGLPSMRVTESQTWLKRLSSNSGLNSLWEIKIILNNVKAPITLAEGTIKILYVILFPSRGRSPGFLPRVILPPVAVKRSKTPWYLP